MKWSEWLIVGLVIPLLYLIVQKFLDRKKGKLEYLKLFAETKLKLVEVANEQIKELEEKNAELIKINADSAKRYKENLDECMRQHTETQNKHLREIELMNKRHEKEMKDLSKQIIARLKK